MLDSFNSCESCYGKGEVGSERGPLDCPDCAGLGRLPSASVLTERRLRELEQRHRGSGSPAPDIRWLVSEVRRGRHALLQIFAASQDRESDDPIANKIKFLANDILALYSTDETDD